VNFLVDNQLPPALARFIQDELKCSAIHVVDVGMRDASDAEVWSYASQTQSILISKDEDFANMVLQVPTAKLIWVRVGNCRKTFLLDLFRQMWPRILQRLDGGDRVIELC
jgi:predicted nuclease of predicted toxin-antitoxin system